MGGLSWVHLVILLIVALLVFGPKRLPEIGRSLGRGIREFKDSTTHLTGKIEEESPSKKPPSSEIPPVGTPTPSATAKPSEPTPPSKPSSDS